MNTKNQELIAELRAMQEVGIKVDDRTLNMARTENLDQYEGIDIEQIASLFVEMYNWT